MGLYTRENIYKTLTTHSVVEGIERELTFNMTNMKLETGLRGVTGPLSSAPHFPRCTDTLCRPTQYDRVGKEWNPE